MRSLHSGSKFSATWNIGWLLGLIYNISLKLLRLSQYLEKFMEILEFPTFQK